MVFSASEFDNHETVAFCSDAESGLRAIIALHSTRAGPAMGGCRIAPYVDFNAALTDVLRLSKGMSYKNIMASLPYGGGEAVILADPRTGKTAEMLTAFARHIDQSADEFITAEDVGTSVADIELMRQTTPHVRGIPANGPGDPSPMTARGVFGGIKRAVAHRLGSSSLEGVTVCVQGLGAVGSRLVALLHEAGAKLLVADIDSSRVGATVASFGAIPVSASRCHAADADVFSPCALGAVLTTATISELRAPVVAGGANNQLHTDLDGEWLASRGVLYAPDFIINAAGVISTALEGPGFDPEELLRRVDGINETLKAIFERADAEGIPTNQVADRMAQERLSAVRRRQGLRHPGLAHLPNSLPSSIETVS